MMLELPFVAIDRAMGEVDHRQYTLTTVQK
jgi:hypothetical protein